MCARSQRKGRKGRLVVKKIIFVLCLLLVAVYALPLLACDCDTAAAITGGMKDRLHQPWPNDPERQKNKPKDSENGPKQEVGQSANQNSQSGGENKK